VRAEAFKSADPNGNGLCSLAELETFVLQRLLTKYPNSGKGKEVRVLLPYKISSIIPQALDSFITFS
jgi:hypothetical protein